MMSIRALGNLGSSGSSAKAAAHYYNEHSADYYVKEVSDEPAGEWIGEGAKRSGFQGIPTREELQLALAGSFGGRQVQNAGKPDRQMGWDLTFSAPKSVSIAWASENALERARIEAAHREAVKVAHRYFEAHSTTRRGYAGLEREQAALVSSMFTHHTSRAGDPQLHSHVVIPNFCVRSDGTAGTIESRAFYEHKLTAGALYQAELAYRMKQLGYGIEPGPRGTFRISEINSQLEELFSKRDQQIDRISKEREIRTYAGTRGIVISTRPPKKHTTFEERQATWKEEARQAGISFEVERRDGAPLQKHSSQEIVQSAAEKLTDQNSLFKERDLVREIARSSYGERSADDVLSLVHSVRSYGVERIGRDKTQESVYSTREMLSLERDMMRMVSRLAQKDGFSVDPSSAFTKQPLLSEEQKASVTAATAGNAIAVIQGRAGTGKTTSLSVIRGAYQAAGYKVQGLTISGQAAQNLQRESGIESKTIASWSRSSESNQRTVLVVDEAGMVGSKRMNEIFQRAEQEGSKVILVGDERQLQPIEAGGALHAVDRELIRVSPESSSQIETIRRQKEEWMRQAVQQAARGNTGQALKALDAHGKIQIYTNAGQAREDLVKAYLEESAPQQDKAVILTHRKGDATQINREVRRELQERGMVGEDRLEINNGQKTIPLAVGDRVMMTKNDYQLDVRNGQRGTIQEIDEAQRSINVRMDGGIDKKISTDSYSSIDYGWASTTHKAQGATVERAYVYGHTQESMSSQQSTYVQISRAREETQIFAVSGESSIERAEEGKKIQGPLGKSEQREEALGEMVRTWGRDASKDTTLDYTHQQSPEKTIEKSIEPELER